MRPIAPPLAALLAGLLSGPLAADEITDQIDQARAYYEDGDVSGAIAELEFTVQALRGKVSAALGATFPGPAAGWTVVTPAPEDSASLPFITGNVTARTYRRGEGGGTIEAQLLTGGSFMQGLASMLMNPQVLAAQPNAKRVRIGRENAVVIFDPADRSGQLMMELGREVSITLQGNDLADSAPLVDLATRWDIAKVREIAGL